MSITLEAKTAPMTLEGIGGHAARTGEPAFLTERRIKAFKFYNETPMPGRTDEIWRRVEFGDLDLNAAMHRAAETNLARLTVLPAETAAKGVFFNAPEVAFRENPALLEEYWNTQVFVPGERGSTSSGLKFHALNQALWENGYVLHAPKGAKVETPLYAEFNTRAGRDGVFPHNLIVLEEGAEATVIERYASRAAGHKGLCCPQTEIVLKAGAKLRYILLQQIGLEAVYVGAHRAHQYADSQLTFVSAHLGSRLSKAFLATKMLEPRAHAYLSGLYYGTDHQKLHIDTLQHHVAPNCTTDLMFKGALNHTSRAVYRGMIHLEPGAQKTDAYQQNRTLLLSDTARVDSIPGLEILANDVRCTHGATAGQIDPTILFYLMSRGLTQFQARKMIMDGFFEEVVLRFGLDEVIEPLRKSVDGKIGEEN